MILSSAVHSIKILHGNVLSDRVVSLAPPTFKRVIASSEYKACSLVFLWLYSEVDVDC